MPKFQYSFLYLIFSSFFARVLASFDLVRCCIKAARDESIRSENAANDYPWKICKLGESIVYPSETQLWSVQKTRAWCNAECAGYQRSETSQWLQPLATWIAPYVALLLVTPIGEISESKTEQIRAAAGSSGARERLLSSMKWFWEWVSGTPWEYILLLGDPASALWGAFSEIISDFRLARRLSDHNSGWLANIALWITMLAGDTKFEHSILWNGFINRLEKEDSQGAQSIRDLDEPTMKNTTPWTMLAEEIIKRTSNTDKVLSSESRDVDKIEPMSSVNAASSSEFSLRQSLSYGVHVLVQGRIDFVKGIFLPVILMLAVAASVFFDAYGKLGDKDTAHALAYGVWYSWLITLSVSGNCFATSVNVGLARKAFGDSLRLSDRRVSLSERYMNAFKWELWLWQIERADPVKADKGHPKREVWFWTKFVLGQLLGWVCVAFACGCAAVISWTTPTVGLGCRSFTYVLYGIGTFIVAVLHVPRQRLIFLSQDRSGQFQMRIATWAHTLLVIFNALVMIVGTIFHLSGVYRSCQCSRLFAKDDTLIEFNRNTEQSVTNARRYWLVTGYVAFSFVWVVCAMAMAARKIIVSKMEKALEDNCFD
ncbi:hypothetical protein BU24DRAFT_81284 [Aaosphaeria arxii CBS 175.79]|uniref:Uncharacterized protein n=1 Tax=Aaosphaeria arxii CBS 175.79 TaxID=1450172 RepID=A0A6A5X9S2_9PLEO|nr:uncharacterized protein BU24DRAFT_81284 [Aaosphaeria arxii CBS 175.79]KAF2009718.1 hypothetical protein BU24DRAFT_81284 [Aaosphaeria arxii CBS 175.79]